MPHIHLETTADLPENAQVPDILEALVRKLETYESVSSASIKAYHSLRSNWVMGSGAPAGFAHVSVAILEGRPAELRQAMSQGLYEVMKEHFNESLEAGEVSLTLEVREMDKGSYRK